MFSDPDAEIALTAPNQSSDEFICQIEPMLSLIPCPGTALEEYCKYTGDTELFMKCAYFLLVFADKRTVVEVVTTTCLGVD